MPKFVAHAASKDHFERIKAERNDPTSQALPEPVLEPKTSAFARLGRHIYRAPTGFLLFAPILCIILMIAGANVAQIEDDVSKIWALKSGDYYKDMEYQESVQTTSTGSGAIAAVAIPREGGNVFSSAYIDEIVDRHNKTEGIEVTHNGVTYTLDDVCFNPVSPYEYPCYRMTSLDCFQEGGYNFDKTATATWQAAFISGAFSSASTSAKATFAATGLCPKECNVLGSSPMDGWETDETCTACYDTAFLSGTTATQFDTMLYAALRTSFISAGVTDAELITTYTYIASVTCGAGGTNDCTIDGDYATGTWATDITCLACYKTGASSGYDNLMPAQIETAYFNAVGAACATCATNELKDAYTKELVQTMVNAYSNVQVLSMFRASLATSVATSVTAAVLTTTYTSIASETCGAGGTNDCTIDGDYATGTWASDTTCLACYKSNGYDNNNAATNSAIYYDAMKAKYGASLTNAEVDAIMESAVESAVYAVADTTAVNTFVATAVCESTNGERGRCDVSTDAWKTDTNCIACYMGFIDGDVAIQASYLSYSALRSSFVSAGVADAKVTTAYTGIVSTMPCSAICTIDGTYATGTWATDATCSACYLGVYGDMTDVQKETTVTDTVKAAVQSLTTYGEVDDFLQTQAKSVVYAYSSAQIDAALTGVVTGYVTNPSKTPYTFQTNSNPLGQPRFEATGATDAEILVAASGTCFSWDEGKGLPEASPFVTIGGSTPENKDAKATNPYENVKALQTIYSFLLPDAIVERVALTNRPGGAVTISESDAEEILYRVKKEFEEVFSDGWDKKSDGEVQFNAFADDAGAPGSFARTLTEVTGSSLGLSLLSYLVTALITCVFLGSGENAVKSRAGLGLFGSVAAVLAFAGSLGMTALLGIKLNIVQTMTLPFLMVGLGMDDMYILALTSEETLAKANLESPFGAQEAFVDAFVDVVVPVTLTSLVNACMFAIMASSDLPAVYLTAVTAVMAVFLLYIMVMTTFAAAVALDFKRQLNDHADVVCCNVLGSDLKTKRADETKTIKHLLWHGLYRPMVTSTVGRFAVFAVTIALVILAGVGLSNLVLGLGLKEFFPLKSQGGEFARLQGEYFPTWSATVNWGKVEYHTADVQLAMVKQWEAVVQTDHMTTLDSTVVWTARLAEWAMPSEYGLGDCDSSNALTSGNCGPSLDATCTGSWAENTLGLRNSTEGGVCRSGGALQAVDSSLDAAKSYCPVLVLSEADYAGCLSKLIVNAPSLYATLSPGIGVEADEVTVTQPIEYSRASGSLLFMYDLFDTYDYIKAINDAREGCDDDDNGPHCWVSGIAFNYWEQYLSIGTWLVTISGFAVLTGFGVATAFFYFGFKGSGGGFECGAAESALVGGFVVAAVSAFAQFTVVGLSCLAGVNLNGLSAMACLMSTGFAVEYSVHVVHRFMTSAEQTPVGRVCEVMEKLILPTTLSFLSSAVGIIVLLFSPFDFVRVYFFVPLFFMLLVTYIYGVFTLPALCCYFSLGMCKSAGPTTATFEKSLPVERSAARPMRRAW